MPLKYPVNPGGAPVTPPGESDTTTTANSTSEAPPKPNYLICDRTGFKVPVSEGLVEEWTGAKVRKQSWEPRHPQDFVRSRPESEGGGGGGGRGSARPEAPDVYDSHELSGGEIVSQNAGFYNIGPGVFYLTASYNSDTDIDLTWTPPLEPVFNVVKFLVYREADDSGTATYLTQVDGDTLTYNDTSVDLSAASATYYIVAIDAGHNFRVSDDAVLALTVDGGPGGTGEPDTTTPTVTDGGTATTYTQPVSVDITVGTFEASGYITAGDVVEAGSLSTDPFYLGSGTDGALVAFGFIGADFFIQWDDSLSVSGLQSRYLIVDIEGSVDGGSVTVSTALADMTEGEPSTPMGNTGVNRLFYDEWDSAFGVLNDWDNSDNTEVKTVTFRSF